jgi:cell division protein ZapE
MGADAGDRARRFTWLIDILYDHRVKLVASAGVAPGALYAEGPNVRDFSRTVSRIAEMRTRDYIARPHITDGADARAA